MSPAPRTVKVRDIVGTYEVRQMCGQWLQDTQRKYTIRARSPQTKDGPLITRHTLLAWRKQGFPKPIKTLRGSGPAGVELWDASEVRDWLNLRGIPEHH